jgi:hypothetical protein
MSASIIARSDTPMMPMAAADSLIRASTAVRHAATGPGSDPPAAAYGPRSCRISAVVQGTFILQSGAAAITYAMAYASSGATAMQYSLHIVAEQI